jgi:hypothetical protein
LPQALWLEWWNLQVVAEAALLLVCTSLDVENDFCICWSGWEN